MDKLEEDLFQQPLNTLANGGYQTGIVTAYSRPVNLELMQKLKSKIAELMHSYGFQDSDIFEEELNALLCSEIGIPLEVACDPEKREKLFLENPMVYNRFVEYYTAADEIIGNLMGGLPADQKIPYVLQLPSTKRKFGKLGKILVGILVGGTIAGLALVPGLVHGMYSPAKIVEHKTTDNKGKKREYFEPGEPVNFTVETSDNRGLDSVKAEVKTPYGLDEIALVRVSKEPAKYLWIIPLEPSKSTWQGKYKPEHVGTYKTDRLTIS